MRQAKKDEKYGAARGGQEDEGFGRYGAGNEPETADEMDMMEEMNQKGGKKNKAGK